jgi:DNA end-binding protein Ku
VKGYEYEKDRFVVLTEEDFKRVDIAATQTIDLLDFVDLAEINPVHFFRPYYLEPQRGGASAYALLRDVLAETGKAGIAKIVLKSRQHLAALKPNGDALVLELMHFAHELVDAHALKLPGETKPGRRELDMAATLVAQMTVPWDAQRYQDDYTAALLTMIDRKVAAGGKELPTAKDAPRPATNVVDLVTALQQSLDRAGAGKAPRRAAAPRPKPERAPPRRAGRRTKASSAAA